MVWADTVVIKLGENWSLSACQMFVYISPIWPSSKKKSSFLVSHSLRFFEGLNESELTADQWRFFSAQKFTFLDFVCHFNAFSLTWLVTPWIRISRLLSNQTIVLQLLMSHEQWRHKQWLTVVRRLDLSRMLCRCRLRRRLARRQRQRRRAGELRWQKSFWWSAGATKHSVTVRNTVSYWFTVTTSMIDRNPSKTSLF